MSENKKVRHARPVNKQTEKITFAKDAECEREKKTIEEINAEIEEQQNKVIRESVDSVAHMTQPFSSNGDYNQPYAYNLPSYTSNSNEIPIPKTEPAKKPSVNDRLKEGAPQSMVLDESQVTGTKKISRGEKKGSIKFGENDVAEDAVEDEVVEREPFNFKPILIGITAIATIAAIAFCAVALLKPRTEIFTPETPEPTETPAVMVVTPEPTEEPKETVVPKETEKPKETADATAKPEETSEPTPTATATPAPEVEPTAKPTEAPVPTQETTVSPTSEPTVEPEQTDIPEQETIKEFKPTKNKFGDYNGSGGRMYFADNSNVMVSWKDHGTQGLIAEGDDTYGFLSGNTGGYVPEKGDEMTWVDTSDNVFVYRCKSVYDTYKKNGKVYLSDGTPMKKATYGLVTMQSGDKVSYWDFIGKEG